MQPASIAMPTCVVPAFQQGIPNALVGGIVSAPFTYTNSTTNTTVYAPGFFRMTPDWPKGVRLTDMRRLLPDARP